MKFLRRLSPVLFAASVALSSALAAEPVTAPATMPSREGMRVLQRGSSYLFEVPAMQTPVSLNILDLQGRSLRALTSTRSGSLAWDGKDASGKPMPFGTYFVRVSNGKQFFSQRLNILP